MDNIKTLITKVEQTTEDEQYVAIYDALVFAHKHEWITNGPYYIALKFLRAGAYESAALLLVPEGRTFWHLSRYSDPAEFASECSFSTYSDDGSEPHHVKSDAATPALALTAAALRAKCAV